MSIATRTYADLDGSEKAAALLLTLPALEAANVIRRLPEPQVERLTVKMLRPDHLSAESQEAILREAHELATAQEHLSTGGVDHARTLLTEAFGSERAEELVNKFMATMQSQPFHYLQDVEPTQITTFLHNEHPQTIALIISYLSARKAAAILSLLPQELQVQVSMRLARIDAINPLVVAQVEAALKKKLSSVLNADISKTGGLDFLVRLLTQVDRGTERAILEQLEESAPELAAEVRKMMFVFDDLTQLDDRSMQRVLRDVDSRDLSLALRGAQHPVRELIMRNVSQRAADMLREELESGAPVRMRTIEEAQQKIVGIVRTLEDEEEIVVARGGPGADVMV